MDKKTDRMKESRQKVGQKDRETYRKTDRKMVNKKERQTEIWIEK